MKKFTAIALALVIVMGLAACGNTGAADNTTGVKPQNLTGTMEEVITAINEAHGAIELPLMSMTLDLTDVDALTYNTGLTTADKVSEVAISEPMMGQPYSLVLVRVKDAADAESVAKEMNEKIDTRKWVCMEADTKVAAYYGDVAMFFMVSTDFADQATTASVLDAFKSVCKGDVTVVE